MKILAFEKDKKILKLLLMDSNKRKATILDYKKCEIEKESKDRIIELIEEFISNNNAFSVKTLCFLPLSVVYIRKLVFPYKSTSKIKKSIKFALEPYIPIPIEDVEVFFHPAPQENNRIEVLAFAISKKLLEEQLELLDSLKLNCQEIYLTPLNLFNLFTLHFQIKERTIWIDIEDESTYVFQITRGGRLIDFREVPVGKNNLSEGKTELKREMNIILLSQDSQKPEDKISEIYISGSPEVPDWLDKSWNIPVEIVKLENLLSVEKGKLSSIPEILYAACGRKGHLAINFYPSILKEKKKKGVVGASTLAFFALLIFSFQLRLERGIYERRYNLANSQIRKIFLETFPEATDTRTPLLQMKSRIKSLKDSISSSSSLFSGKVSPLEVLKEISKGIEKNLPVELDSFTFREKIVSIAGTTPSYQNVDKIKDSLIASPLFSSVEIKSAESSAKGVKFILELIVGEK